MHSFGAYAVALHAEFGWSKTALAGAFSLTRVESGLLGPLQGWLVDRFGPRLILRIGLVIFAAGFMVFALTDSLLVFYASWALIAVGSSLGGFATLTVAIVNWFDQHRAKAVAVSQLGFGLGGLCVPVVILALEFVGWRWTAFASGVVVLLIGLPLVQLVHHRPESIGEIPDGTDEPHPVIARRRIPDRDLTPARSNAHAGVLVYLHGPCTSVADGVGGNRAPHSACHGGLGVHNHAGRVRHRADDGESDHRATARRLAGRSLRQTLGVRGLHARPRRRVHAAGVCHRLEHDHRLRRAARLGLGCPRPAHGGVACRLFRCHVVRHDHGLFVTGRHARHGLRRGVCRGDGRHLWQLRHRLRSARHRLRSRRYPVRHLQETPSVRGSACVL